MFSKHFGMFDRYGTSPGQDQRTEALIFAEDATKFSGRNFVLFQEKFQHIDRRSFLRLPSGCAIVFVNKVRNQVKIVLLILVEIMTGQSVHNGSRFLVLGIIVDLSWQMGSPYSLFS